MSSNLERWVRARKDYSCDALDPQSTAIQIRAGQKYLLVTEYPGGNPIYGDAYRTGRPQRFRVCADCASEKPDDGQP